MRYAGASTPRNGTLASVPVERLGNSRLTYNSEEAATTPGALAMMRVSSLLMMLVISVSAPLRMTSAAAGEPPVVMARRNPWAMDSIPTSTATTPAMPKTAAAAAPLRSGRLDKLNRVSTAA
jgi:hypothetical protein